MLGGAFKGLRKPVSLVVEDAEEGDVSHLADIHREGFTQAWSDGELAKLIANDSYFCLVAREKGKSGKPPSAFVLVRTAADEAEVITIATRKSVRRKGAARQLLDAAVRKLQADRAISLFLEVDENNDPAISLYRKLGFKTVGERKGYYASQDREKPSTALVMQRDLG
ncbi:MAG: N-acetyltransferase [Rhizobiaceae bacterium]|nr:N-acetyltransferase [Rhizobiaceae bacterium]